MTLAVLNPATEETIAEIEQAGARRRTPRLLRRLATLVEEHAEELARVETRNVGKPIASARGEVAMAARVFHF